MIVLHAKDGGSIPPLGTNYLLEPILISQDCESGAIGFVGANPTSPTTYIGE